MNKKIVLVSRPNGMAKLSNFKLEEGEIPRISEKELLVQALYISVDPYMRGRMNDRPSYIPPFQLNHALNGYGVGRVIESQDPRFKPGEIVTGFLDWSEYSLVNGDHVRLVDPNAGSISSSLGILGMPGMTAYFGLLDIGKPRAGETVVVSGAAGAVGLVVGQIAKLKGCKVVGIAGGNEKVNLLKQEFDFDQAIDYKSPEFEKKLSEACPNGVDVYFDNVGGTVTDQVLKLINIRARLVICGQISMYNLDQPDVGLRPFPILLMKSALAQGFIITRDYGERFPEGIKEMAQWMMQRKIKEKESIVNGIENAPKAFLGLFSGENTGKQLVKVAD